MPITPLPTPAPTRLMSEEEFATNADNLVAALPTFVTEANALQADVNSKQVTATNAATTATTQATNASNSATAAALSETAARNHKNSAQASATDAASSAVSAASSAASAAGNSVLQKYKFDTSVTMSEPATGYVRFNNATATSVTRIAVDAQTADAGNPNILGWLRTFDDSTSVVKGQLLFSKTGNPLSFTVYNVSSITENAGWVQIDVLYVAGSGGFSQNDVLVMDFKRSGDAGVTLVPATQVEMEQGAETGLRSMSPLRVRQAVEAPMRRMVGVRGAFVDLGAGSNIDLSLGNYFAKTITGATTFTVSNVPSSGTAITFSLELTNAGAYTINLWSGVKKAGDAAVTFTASGRDRLFFTTRDGGATWDMAVLKDMK